MQCWPMPTCLSRTGLKPSTILPSFTISLLLTLSLLPPPRHIQAQSQMSLDSMFSVVWHIFISLSNYRTNCPPTPCHAHFTGSHNNTALFALFTTPHNVFSSLMMLYSTKGAQFRTMSALSSNPTTLNPLHLPPLPFYHLLFHPLPLLTYLLELFLLLPLVPSIPFTLLSQMTTLITMSHLMATAPTSLMLRPQR